MIPLQGTVEVRIQPRTGEPYSISCPVIAASEDDFLVIPTSYRGARASATPRWASEIGTVCEFTPEPAHVPAAPGWWARLAFYVKETGQVGSSMHPVVAWRLGEDPGPVVLDSACYSDRWDTISENLGEDTIACSVDAIIFDPDRRPELPEVDETAVRPHEAPSAGNRASR